MSPLEQIEIRVGAERFAALASGEGPLVLLLHGFPDVPRSWAPVMEQLAGSHRCVAPWTRGYAPSTLDGPFDADRLAADAIGFADALSPDAPVLLVGHDWGAATAYVACMRAPERFAGCVAISVPHPLAFFAYMARHPGQLRRSAYMGFFQLPVLPERAIRRGDLVERLWRAWSPRLTPPQGHLAEVVETVRRSLPGPLAYYRAMTRPPREALARVVDARGERISVPTAYLHGADDRCVRPEAARGQERYFQEPLSSEVVEGAGHFLPLERPDAVARAVRRLQRA